MDAGRHAAARPRAPWSVTYADLVSLLVVFFVLFYALSSRRPEAVSAAASSGSLHEPRLAAARVTLPASTAGVLIPVAEVLLDPRTGACSTQELAGLARATERLGGESAPVLVLGLYTAGVHGAETTARALARAAADHLGRRGIDQGRLRVGTLPRSAASSWISARPRRDPGCAAVRICLAPGSRS